MVWKEAASIAAKCRHYAMCKIDFLGIGVCPAGTENHFVSYYPQGRMDIYNALANKLIPVTNRLVHIAESCTLCGICEKQCHFITELNPLTVMKALKLYVKDYLSDHNPITETEADPLLLQFQDITGEQFASDDPAIRITYAYDPSPTCELTMPRLVVMPASTEQVKDIVTLCKRHGIPFNVRGNGSSVIGIVMSEGVVIDTNRMKGIKIDKDNWTAEIGAGVSAFDLQNEVQGEGFRICTAEPSALVCGNIICSGLLSTFSNAYGTGAEHCVNAEFVDQNGNSFTLNEWSAPNLFGYDKNGRVLPGICTRATVKLYPFSEDEEGLMVPFSSFQEGAEFCRELCSRRIGISVALLGKEYISAFMSPTLDLADKLKTVLAEKLGILYCAVIIGDKYAVDSIKKMTPAVINGKLFRLLMLSLPQLVNPQSMDLLSNLESIGNEKPYEILCKPEMLTLLEAMLNPSPENIASAVPYELKDFYTKLYSVPQMTDLVWLNTFRIQSSRMGRRKHFVPFIGYVPLDKMDVILEINAQFRRIADRNGVTNDFGFLTPIDLGKRAILEYDYFVDQTNREDITRVKKASAEGLNMIYEMRKTVKGIEWINTILSQGFSRREAFLYE